MSKVSPGATFSSSQFLLHLPSSWVRKEVTWAADLLMSSNFQLLAKAGAGTAQARTSAQAPRRSMDDMREPPSDAVCAATSLISLIL
jgi:hypothetical protein